MDYSLLLGIHDVERAEREEDDEEEEEEEEEDEETGLPYEEEEEDENGLASSQGIAGYMNSFKPIGAGEFDPYVDVYALQSAVGESWELS